MGIISNRIDRRSLKRGDHIYCYRNVHTYSHHGIYIGDNRVIHFTRTEDPDDQHKSPQSWKSSSSQSNSNNYSCKDDDCIGSDKNNYKNNNPKEGARGVVKCCLDCFLEGRGLFRFEYGVSNTRFRLNSSGTCTTSPTNAGPEEAIKRATEMLEQIGGFGKYNLLNNNCESFAVYCKTGKRVSFQALSLVNKIDNGLDNNPFSIRNIGKTLYNYTWKHKRDMLRHSHAINNGY